MTFSSGDPVTIIREVRVYGAIIAPGTHATYHQRSPFTFIEPACDVLIDGITGPYGYPYVAVSEGSIVHRVVDKQVISSISRY